MKKKKNRNFNRKKAEKYLEKATSSMAILENLEMNNKNLRAIVEYKTFEKNFIYEARIFIDLSEAWNHMKITLDEPLTLEYIIDINARLAKNQALFVGELRNQKNTVTSEYIEVEIPYEDDLKEFLKNNLSETKNIEENILKLFCHIITNQWFWDGNKRTAFIIAKKGVLPKLIYMDDLAKDTVGNAIYSTEILATLKPEKVTLISSASHIRRGLSVFQEAANLKELNIEYSNLVYLDYPTLEEAQKVSEAEKLVIYVVFKIIYKFHSYILFQESI